MMFYLLDSPRGLRKGFRYLKGLRMNVQETLRPPSTRNPPFLVEGSILWMRYVFLHWEIMKVASFIVALQHIVPLK